MARSNSRWWLQWMRGSEYTGRSLVTRSPWKRGKLSVEQLENRIVPALVKLTGVPTVTEVNGYGGASVDSGSISAAVTSGYYANTFAEGTDLDASYVFGGSVHVEIVKEANETDRAPITITISLSARATSTDPRGSAQAAISASNAPGQGVEASAGGTESASNEINLKGKIGDSFDINISGSGSLGPFVADGGSYPEMILNASVYASVSVTALVLPVLQPTLAWNAAGDGVDLGYTVADAPVSQDTKVALYWSSTDQFADHIGGPIAGTTQAVARGTGTGAFGPVQINAATLGTPPKGATHLLAVADPDNTLGNFDATKNVTALINPDPTVDSAAFDTSAGKLDVAYTVPQLSAPDGTLLHLDWTDGVGKSLGSALKPIDISGQMGSQSKTVALADLTPPPDGAVTLTASITEPNGSGGADTVPQKRSADLSVLSFTPTLSVPTDDNTTSSPAGSFGPYLAGVSLDTPFTLSAPQTAGSWSPASLVTTVTFAFPNSNKVIKSNPAQPGSFTASTDVGTIAVGSHQMVVTTRWGRFQLSKIVAQIVVEDKFSIKLRANLGSGDAVDVNTLRFINGVTLNEEFRGDFGGMLPPVYNAQVGGVGLGDKVFGVTNQQTGTFVLDRFDVGALSAGSLVPSLEIGGKTFQTDGTTSLLVIDLPQWLKPLTPTADPATASYEFIGSSSVFDFPNPHLKTTLTDVFPGLDEQLHGLETYVSLVGTFDVVAPLALAGTPTFSVKSLVAKSSLLGQQQPDYDLTPKAGQFTGKLNATTLAADQLTFATDITNLGTFDFHITPSFHYKPAPLLGLVDGVLTADISAKLDLSGQVSLSLRSGEGGNLTWNPQETYFKLTGKFKHEVTLTGEVLVAGQSAVAVTAKGAATITLAGVIHFGSDLDLLHLVVDQPDSSLTATLELGYKYQAVVLGKDLVHNDNYPDFNTTGAISLFELHPTISSVVVDADGNLLIHSPVALMIVDPQGRRLGVDPTTGKSVNDFGPQATDSGTNSEPEILTLPLSLVVPGQYQFTGVGTGSGSYTIELQVAAHGDPSNIVLDQTLATGMTSLGQPIAPISPIDIQATLTNNKSALSPIATPTATLVTTQTQDDSAFFSFTGSNNFGVPSALVFQTQLDNGVFTNAKGTSVTFTNLAAGPHVFRVHAIDQAGNVSPDVSYSWSVAASAPPPGAGVGIIVGVVFLDANDNGIQDAGERGDAGITVYLDDNNNGRLDPGEATAVTGADGSYSFANLATGAYYLRTHARYTLPTAPANGTDAITLAGGDRQTANFGIINISPGLPLPAPSVIYAPPTSKTAPNADLDAFIRGLYHSVLNRDVEIEGGTLIYWENVFNAVKTNPQALGLPVGADPALFVAQGFWISQEHRWREVESYYHNFLGRDLDLTNSQDVRVGQYWANQFLFAGAVESEVMRGFLTSGEYLLNHRAEGSLADALNADLLAGSAAVPELQAWKASLDALDGRRAALNNQTFATADDYKTRLVGSLSGLDNEAAQTGVLFDVLNSDGYARRALDSFYIAFLHRAGTQVEEQTLRGQRDSAGHPLDLGTIAELVLSSQQYRANAVGSEVS